ncbi:MAG: hypothetical protein WCF84_04460 [Anaerolineae bacterium]
MSSQQGNVAGPEHPFRLFLFADQPLGQLLAGHARWPDLGPGDSWDLWDEAYRLQSQGKTDAARNLLDRVLKMDHLDTQAALWTWAALRGAGVIPHNGNHHRVRGVVLEVPMHAGVDTVAVYENGAGCYINYTGQSPVIWDRAEAPVAEYIAQIISIVQPLTGDMPPAYTHPVPPRTEVSITALTYGGSLRSRTSLVDFIEGTSPFSPLYAAGGDLVSAVVERVWADQAKLVSGAE